MPEYAVLMYHPRPGEGEPTDRAPHDAYARSMETSGELVFARGLADPRQARSLRADGATEGPYLESAEAVVGVYVVEAPDLGPARRLSRALGSTACRAPWTTSRSRCARSA